MHTAGAALADMAAKDVRGALSLGCSNTTDDIDEIAKQDSGILCALRDGQVKSWRIFVSAVQRPCLWTAFVALMFM